ncbi:hypothetical protein [Stenotrophomonas sp. BIGb0135]|uniref:hypothetical protein n=1 Tax=Stenotrophomonas sp. BIGb0135 TaxID=2940620 RepID=UPI00216A7218|nr:hypothetical protein [Stenotrophomonas sp. BIGb0135]MCS4236659.1 hypothetical protein [Stenotrophomonas sp. BIGb0135]
MSRLPVLPGVLIPKNEKLNFTWNADLVFYDGPLVSLFKKDDDDFIFFWVDADSRHNRWVVTPVGRGDLAQYLEARLSLRAIIDKAELLLVFEATKQAQRKNARTIVPSKLLAEYMPDQDSFLYESIATEAALQLASADVGKYRIALDGELYIDDIATVPRVYQQLYSFHYGLGNLGRPAVRTTLNRFLTSWKGGINAVNIFTGLRGVTPSIHRARVLELHYASPGHIELELLKEFAADIARTCQQIVPIESYRKSEKLYSDIYVYFRKEQLSGFDSDGGSASHRLTPMQSKALSGFVDEYFDIVNWDRYKNEFQGLGLDPLTQLRMLLAYYRRLRVLRRYSVQGKISLL